MRALRACMGTVCVWVRCVRECNVPMRACEEAGASAFIAAWSDSSVLFSARHRSFNWRSRWLRSCSSKCTCVERTRVCSASFSWSTTHSGGHARRRSSSRYWRVSSEIVCRSGAATHAVGDAPLTSKAGGCRGGRGEGGVRGGGTLGFQELPKHAATVRRAARCTQREHGVGIVPVAQPETDGVLFRPS